MPSKKLSEGTHYVPIFCLPVNKWGTQQQHTLQYPSHSQHHLLQHTVFISKLCWNFSVLFDELIIFTPVDSVSAVLVQKLQDRSLMSAFPSLKCRVVCTLADVCIDANKTDWQICSEIFLVHNILTTSWWCNEASLTANLLLWLVYTFWCTCTVLVFQGGVKMIPPAM